MTHFVERLRLEADEAILRMQAAAREARRRHALAELMRHMLTTARKVKDRPRAEAVEAVVGEWMKAWSLARAEWPQLAQEMESFTQAFYDYANAASEENDRRVAERCAALDAALAREGTSIADQMAFRSECAHGWWEWVEPTPADLPGARERPNVPRPQPGAPFWNAGCAAFCR